MRSTRPSLRHPCTLLMMLGICLIPVLCGALVIVQQIDRALDAAARSNAMRALYVVDRVFDMLRVTSNHLAHVPQGKCAALAPHSLASVNGSRLIQSWSVKQPDDSWCSSSGWEIANVGLFNQFVEQRVSLASQASTSPRTGTLVFAWPGNERALLAGINGQQLHHQLSKFARGEVLQLDVGDHSIWMSNDGYAREHPGPSSSNRISKRSSEYGYTIHAGYSAGTFQQMFWAYGTRALPLLLLTGLVTGACVYLVLVKSHQPGYRRRRNGTCVWHQSVWSTPRRT